MNQFLTVNTFCSLLWALTFSFPKKVTNSCHLLPQTDDHQCKGKSRPFETYWWDIKSQWLFKATFLCYWVQMNTVNNTGRLLHNILSSVSFQRSLLTPASQRECVDTVLGPKRWLFKSQWNSLGETANFSISMDIQKELSNRKLSLWFHTHSRSRTDSSTYVSCQPEKYHTGKVNKEKSGEQDKEVHQHLGGSVRKGP